jgi:hypothetical protein
MNHFIFTCSRTGETQDYYACDRHAEGIVVDGDNVRAYDCDDDIACDGCEALAIARRKSAILTGTPQEAHDAIIDDLHSLLEGRN